MKQDWKLITRVTLVYSIMCYIYVVDHALVLHITSLGNSRYLSGTKISILEIPMYNKQWEGFIIQSILSQN